MGEEYQTLTSEMDVSGPESSSGDASDVQPPENKGAEPSGETLKTDQGAPKGDAGKPAKEDAGTEGKEPPKAETQPEDDTRFDKHPRWQEMLRERNAERERAIALEAELKAHKELMAKRDESAQKGKAEQPPAKDYEAEFKRLDKALDNGDISVDEHRSQSGKLFREQAREEAKALAEERVNAVLKEYREKERQRVEEERHRAIRDKQAKWLAENPKFTELVKDGTLEKIKKEDPFGLHDDYSAYLVWKAGEEKAAAVKEAEEKHKANLKAKREAQTLTAGPAVTPSEPVDPTLKDSKKFGGRTSVLAEKLAAMRRAAGSG